MITRKRSLRTAYKGCSEMLSFWKQSVTRKRPGTTTERGQTVPDWSNASSLIIKGCSVQPATTSLDQDGRILGITDGFTAYLPAGSDVIAGDHIIFNGKEYTIDGEPRPWLSPSGRVDHIQLNLMRWQG